MLTALAMVRLQRRVAAAANRFEDRVPGVRGFNAPRTPHHISVQIRRSALRHNENANRKIPSTFKELNARLFGNKVVGR